MDVNYGQKRSPSYHFIQKQCSTQPIPVVLQYKACVCGRSLAGIQDSHPAGGMDVSLLWVLCVVRKSSLRRADDSSRGVLLTVLCLGGDREASITKTPWRIRGCCDMTKKLYTHACHLPCHEMSLSEWKANFSEVPSLNSCTIPACNWNNGERQPGYQYAYVYKRNKLVVLRETWFFNIS